MPNGVRRVPLFRDPVFPLMKHHKANSAASVGSCKGKGTDKQGETPKVELLSFAEKMFTHVSLHDKVRQNFLDLN
jgi:hypothetical protein